MIIMNLMYANKYRINYFFYKKRKEIIIRLIPTFSFFHYVNNTTFFKQSDSVCDTTTTHKGIRTYLKSQVHTQEKIYMYIHVFKRSETCKVTYLKNDT